MKQPFKKQVTGYRFRVSAISLFLKPVTRNLKPLLLFSFLFSLSSFLFAFAVTYRVDPANGPDTLAAEVKAAFDAWVALSEKIEVSETEENPEGVFQYGAPERFGSDILSLTVQRQSDTRTISYLISPNAENRKRILLHETGIAIGLTPQIPGTPSPNAPTTPNTPAPTTPPTEGTTLATGEEQETFETTPLPETSPPEPSSSTPSDSTETTNPDSTSTEPSGETTTEGPTESTPEPSTNTQDQTTQDSSTTQSTETQPTEGVAESTPATEEPSTTEQPTTPPEEATETPTSALTPNSVMNPSISPDDSVELGEVEKQLIDRLQLFVSEDINKDGTVNFYDLVALSQAFGRSGVNDPADINKDGVIDQSDVDELQKVYTFSDPSETAPGGSTTPTDDTPPEGTEPPTDGTVPPTDGAVPPRDTGTPPTDGSGE
jgi:Dockerin type I domain